ncbi:hypothetical protein WG68_17915 [Arsukibacterium ikkense]|uniref:Outer membrane protein beta-barrel domain-containing protein n=1 Tax=Arsukibacterium ikkense TaxID=336831 RepID=A0A0M2V479_9GAMM|nr:outer membrane beta-barrel protein [Arsukibacterium ikkense]KKO43973.1 hypothetical protein WG68_17915 [Arsukibacterium ikkense]
MKTKTKCWFHTFGVTALILTSITFIFPGSAQAQAFERDWKVSIHTGRASLDSMTEGTEKWLGMETEMWHHITDDSGTVLGGSISYLLHPNLSVRGTYERAKDFHTVNSCKPDVVCLTVLISERGDVEHAAIALVPELSLSDKVDLFGSIGFGTTRKSAGPVLTSYSDNSLVYGAGLSYRLSSRLYLSSEYQRAGSDYNVFRFAFGIRF